MKKTTTTRATAPGPVPPQLAGLVALIEPPDSDRASEMARALDAARRFLRDALREDVDDHVATFIHREAARGPWKNLHRLIDSLVRPEDSSLNAITGDVFNVYSVPALAIGMALAYVFLKEGGAE